MADLDTEVTGGGFDRPLHVVQTATAIPALMDTQRPTAWQWCLPFADGQPQTFHNPNEIMAKIVAKRIVEHLERAGFVVMERRPLISAVALGG